MYHKNINKFYVKLMYIHKIFNYTDARYILEVLRKVYIKI